MLVGCYRNEGGEDGLTGILEIERPTGGGNGIWKRNWEIFLVVV